MAKKIWALILPVVVVFTAVSATSPLFSQEQKTSLGEELIAKLRDAKDVEEVASGYENAIAKCATYEDYEKIADDLKKFSARQKDYQFSDYLNYACAKTRLEELSYLTKKNDIESGRIYMSVNEKYYNEALESLDKALAATKSNSLEADVYLLKFIIFKESFQPQKVDAVFNEMVNKIATYSDDSAKNLAKLNEMSKKFSDKGFADYAMKLKLLFASKVDPESAKKIAEDIKTDADAYFDKGDNKDAQSTYDIYLQLAETYYDKDTIASKVMDIAERYFNKGLYKDAIKYYSLFLFKFGASPTADYCSYKLALSYYNDRDYPKAVEKFGEFLKTYQNSVWFEKGFESLCRIYYETSVRENAIGNLQQLIDAYPRRDTGDYAYLLIGVLHYEKAEYDKALEVLKKIQSAYPRTAYLYTTDVLITDINDIKKGASPSFSFGSKDVYKIWAAYTPINADITVGEGGQAVENKEAKRGEIFAKAKVGSKVTFTITGLEDMDRFNEFWQDKEDESRLPRQIRDETEKDLVFFTWSTPDSGKLLDDKQTLSRAWEAPKEPGEYAIAVNIGDLALVRPPDSGSRKDAAKALTIHVTVEK